MGQNQWVDVYQQAFSPASDFVHVEDFGVGKFAFVSAHRGIIAWGKIDAKLTR